MAQTVSRLLGRQAKGGDQAKGVAEKVEVSTTRHVRLCAVISPSFTIGSDHLRALDVFIVLRALLTPLIVPHLCI